MTPGARVAAAIEILDKIRDGTPAERALTKWARTSRYAGSKDRAAIRDHVFDVLRARRSLGDGSGRALMIALAQRDGLDIDQLFHGEGHAPSPLTPEERIAPAVGGAAACDIPDWLWPQWQANLGDDALAAAKTQQARAAVYLRVNMRRTNPTKAIEMLAQDGILAEPHTQVATALRVLDNARRVKSSAAYLQGYVELQDASSQQAVSGLHVPKGARVLDFCAGGGGKALALADLHDCSVFAHDIDPGRMKDLPVRAVRAGVDIAVLKPADLEKSGLFQVVFCDAPCSGSGTWRRTPDAKWRLSAEDLAAYHQTQSDVIRAAAALVLDDGLLAYATCSVLDLENEDVISDFLKTHREWSVVHTNRWVPTADWDGFFLCGLRKNSSNL